MTINERIKKVRKALDLTQREFGEHIGMKQNSIAQVEMGRNTSDQTIFAICREFNVNEDWLRTGEGEMFKADASDVMEALANKYHLSHGAQILVEKFVNLKSSQQDVIVRYIEEVARSFGGSMDDGIDLYEREGFSSANPDELHAELDRQIADEKVAEEKSEVS